MTILLIILAIYCLLCWAIAIMGFRPTDVDTWGTVLLFPVLLPMAALFIFVMVVL